MSHKTILITGGAQGIGKGMVRHFLEKDFAVCFADKDNEAGIETVEEYRNLGSVHFVETDAGSEEQVKRAVEETVAQFGGLHALINNAGIAKAFNTPLEELPLEEWNTVLRTNLTGYFLFAKYTVPWLRKTKGAIVNIASTRALQSEPHSEAYTASKGGVVALTHALACSLGPDIRVNCISPGWIEVSAWKKKACWKEPVLQAMDHLQHPAGRVGEPRDIAALAAFLISDEAGFITGQNFVVDGGMTKKMIYVE